MKADITVHSKDAIRQIQSIAHYVEPETSAYAIERFSAIISSAEFEKENLLKDIQEGVDNNEHEDETSKHIKRSFA